MDADILLRRKETAQPLPKMASDSSTSKKADKAPATATETKPEEEKPAQKSAALEEDDEFEDFPVDG